MAYFSVGNPEALMECPYDKTHMVRNKRMQYHLIDCRKNHMNREMKVCPYNAKHVHPAAEHQFHLVHCPDRNIIDRDIVYESEEKYDSIVAQPQGCVDVPPYNRDSAAGVTEDWDNEAVSEPFDILNKISFSISRSRSEPVMAHAPPVLRQPKQEPEVLGERSEAGGNDDARSVLEERRKPRATNASLASITVSRSSLQDDAATGGQRVTGAKIKAATASSNDKKTQMPPGIGRGRAVFFTVMDSDNMRRVGLSPGGRQPATEPLVAIARGKLMSTTSDTRGVGNQRPPPSVNTTVQRQPATITPAFSLPGIGRGATSAKPPSASTLPMPTFS